MAWNLFKFCTTHRCLGSIMILFVLGVVGVSYYTIVIITYVPEIAAGRFDAVMAVIILILFHFLLLMLLWSYFSVVFTDPGTVPQKWRPDLELESGEETEELTASELPLNSENNKNRFCTKCNQMKPPRCHHCSVCGRCVLKMDHHCVWVANCVGALNYKYFLLFLFYTFLETTLVTLALLPQFIDTAPGFLATTFLSFVLNLAFALLVLGYLIMHVSLVSSNTTTIESQEKKGILKSRFDLGKRQNFEQVFGLDKKYWFIPFYSEEDLRRIPALQGLEYPSNPELESHV